MVSARDRRRFWRAGHSRHGVVVGGSVGAVMVRHGSEQRDAGRQRDRRYRRSDLFRDARRMGGSAVVERNRVGGQPRTPDTGDAHRERDDRRRETRRVGGGSRIGHRYGHADRRAYRLGCDQHSVSARRIELATRHIREQFRLLARPLRLRFRAGICGGEQRRGHVGIGGPAASRYHGQLGALRRHHWPGDRGLPGPHRLGKRSEAAIPPGERALERDGDSRHLGSRGGGPRRLQPDGIASSGFQLRDPVRTAVVVD